MHNCIDGCVEIDSRVSPDGVLERFVTVKAPGDSGEWMRALLTVTDLADEGTITLPASARIRGSISAGQYQQLTFTIPSMASLGASDGDDPRFTFLGLCKNVRFSTPTKWGLDIQIGSTEGERVA